MDWRKLHCPGCGARLATHDPRWIRTGEFLGRAWCDYCKRMRVIRISREEQMEQIRADMQQFSAEAYGEDFGEWEHEMEEGDDAATN